MAEFFVFMLVEGADGSQRPEGCPQGKGRQENRSGLVSPSSSDILQLPNSAGSLKAQEIAVAPGGTADT